MAETGHAKNVENWQKMIAACTGFGGDYKPSNANLTVAAMTTLLTDVETEMDGVQTSIVPWKNKVCKRWDSFSNFLSDMGRRPSRFHTVERKNANGDYKPSNCYWATRREQSRNKRNTFQATFLGVTKTLSEWCEIRDLDYNVVVSRMKQMKWTAEKALTTPTRRNYEEYLVTKKRKHET